MNRRNVLAALFVVVCGVFIYNWICNWGLVTLNYSNAPLSTVVKSAERQGWVTIATNVSGTTPVTIHVQKMPIYEALDTLATRIDGEVNLAYVAAPTSREVKEALIDFSTSTNPGTWTAFSGGFGGGGGDFGGGSEVDQRQMDWKVSDSKDHSLQGILSQGSQKTGITFAVPTSWNPVLGKLPNSSSVGKVAKAVIAEAKGSMQEVFLLTIHHRGRDSADDDGGGRERTIFSGHRGGRGDMNQEWMAERAQAQINLLPDDERADAQTIYDKMHTMMASTKGLSDDERHKKFEALMADQALQDAMQERMADQSGKSSPEQRENRMRSYVQAKAAAVSAGKMH